LGTETDLESRFYRQVKKTLIFVTALMLCLSPHGFSILAGEKTMPKEVDSIRIIFNFEDAKQADQWNAVNDNVMGGISEGGATISDDSCLIFSGSLSLENKGGFSSIRTLPQDFKLGGYKGIRLRVMGDGRTYQFRLRDNRNFDGVAFKQEFQTTADTWLEINLPFDSFLPSFRGRILQDVEAIVASEIRQMGFLIADKKSGQFVLKVDEIKAYK
jgi:monofunctional biosynthetic peptidoglycan transglycosylase